MGVAGIVLSLLLLIYLDIGVVTVLCPLAGTLTVLALGSALGSF